MPPRVHLNFVNSQEPSQGVLISLGEDYELPKFEYELSWQDMNHWFSQYTALERCKDAFAYRLKDKPVVEPGEAPF